MSNSASQNQYKYEHNNSNWSGTNLAVMIGGFVLFPPIGFIALAWMVFGKNVDIIGTIKGKASKMSRSSHCKGRGHRRHYGNTGNMAFDTYKAESISKLEEEMQRRKEQLKEEQTAFNEFVINLQQSKDQAEFNQFMKAQQAAENAAKNDKEDDSK